MKFEESAGGIVYKPSLRPDGLKKEDNQVFILVVQHSQHHGWGFPKGLIGPGEDKKTTALREVVEEGGVEAKIAGELPPTEYFYQFGDQKIKKKVTYFLMQYISGDPEDHEWEMEDAQWILEEEVIERLTFKSDKEVFQKAQKLLKKRD